MKSGYVSVRCEPEMREALRLAAKKDGRPMSELARLIVRNWLIEKRYLESVDKIEQK
jgi:hypothetical protein